MSANAPRSIDEYLKQLRGALAGEDAALVQDALYDAEEYLRAELAAHPERSEADVLELIASTYGAPDEVAAAYRDTEVKVKAALRPPAPSATAQRSGIRRFFAVFMDVRAYTSLFYMLLTLATGIVYFTFVVTGLALSAGFAVLVIGIPFFLAFIGIARVIALGEGRLLEATTGERMPRRPVHPGPPGGWLRRIGDMMKDVRTWTTLLYLLLMLPLGIIYFTVAVTVLAVGLAFTATPFLAVAQSLGLLHDTVLFSDDARIGDIAVADHSLLTSLLLGVLGVLLVTLLMHLARAIARGHARLAKSLLVEPAA
ncbi:MAG: sensor domain-containing protein [Gammaproteobacteria bacterium]|nr:sensor domain-containing protein [Gammaproteobacteria bacterium]MBV8405300.1 sensor domain-containing protein [Gammaproteobacteria bacterium]